MSLPNDIDFLQQLSRLIYCAGTIDGHFSKVEKKEALELIHQLSVKDFDNYSAELMIKEIGDLVSHQSNTDILITEFTNYYEVNSALFTEEVKRKILQILDNIVYIQSKRNKSELTFLSNLEMLFFNHLL